MSNEKSILPFYKKLNDKIINEEFIIDKSGVKVVELIAPRIKLDPGQRFLDFEGRVSPRKYIIKEDKWYNSHELKITKVDDIKIWQQVSDINNEINSNYGNLVFSRNNYSQFSNVVKTLENHKESRQGIIIYTRPSIHYEWNSLESSDFICTNYQQFFIRENRLHCVTSMRSCDAWFGAFNDIPWFHSVIQKMHLKLLKTYPNLEYGSHIYIPNSFHIYERHFDKLNDLIKTNIL